MSSDPFANYYVDEKEKIQTPNETVSINQQEESDPFGSYYADSESIKTNQLEEKESAQPLKKPYIETLKKAAVKSGRLASQFGIGGLQMAAFPYDTAAILSKKIGEQNAPQIFRQQNFKDIKEILDKKSKGISTPEDEERYTHLLGLINDPKKAKEYLPKEIPSFDVASLIEKGAEQFGVDLKPKDMSEMAARWTGFIKNPAQAQKLMENPNSLKNIKEIGKAIFPSGKEAVRGAAASAGLQYAADRNFGPMGTMMMAVMGDLAPSGAAGLVKTAVNLPKNISQASKKASASLLTKMMTNSKKDIQQKVVKEFRDANIQADLGTITDSKLIQWLQTTLKNSPLTGSELEKFQKNLTKNIVDEYGKIANELGELKYNTHFDAGEVLKEALIKAKDADKARYREMYAKATELGADQNIYAGNVSSQIAEIEEKLRPGSYKSAEQKAVLKILQDVKKDVTTVDGLSKGASINSLINNKIALHDAIKYEVEGGTKKLLGQVAKQIDDALIAHGKENPEFAMYLKQADKKFAKHAELFRGQTLGKSYFLQDPEKVFAKMNTPHGVREIKNALSHSPEGRETFKEIARYKIEDMLGKNLIDSTTEQLQLGKFSKLLEKGQSKNVVKELIGEEGLQRIQRLQKSTGRLANTAQKFFNASKSGYQVTSVALVGKVLHDIGWLLSGNPWPLAKTAGLAVSAKQASKLMSDPEFLKLVEESMFVSERGTQSQLMNMGKKLTSKMDELLKESKERYPAVN
jgi:hypothetical protein